MPRSVIMGPDVDAIYPRHWVASSGCSITASSSRYSANYYDIFPSILDHSLGTKPGKSLNDISTQWHNDHVTDQASRRGHFPSLGFSSSARARPRLSSAAPTCKSAGLRPSVDDLLHHLSDPYFSSNLGTRSGTIRHLPHSSPARLDVMCSGHQVRAAASGSGQYWSKSEIHHHFQKATLFRSPLSGMMS
eukprot:scpid82306/ scgid21020/ 